MIGNWSTLLYEHLRQLQPP